MLVVPREILPRRLYTAPAIGLALCLWGLLAATTAAVRRRVSPLLVVGATAHGTWITLHRWAIAMTERRLFATVTSRAPPSPTMTRRRQAERGIAAIVALAPDEPTLEAAAFTGAVRHLG
jgi:hypothetical protein